MLDLVVGVGDGPADSAACGVGQFVHEVEHLAQVAAELVMGVHCDGIAGAGVGQEPIQAVAVDGGAGRLVNVDPIIRDPGRRQSVELSGKGLFGCGDAGVSEFEPALRVATVNTQSWTVPEFSVRSSRNASFGTTFGTSRPALLATQARTAAAAGRRRPPPTTCTATSSPPPERSTAWRRPWPAWVCWPTPWPWTCASPRTTSRDSLLPRLLWRVSAWSDRVQSVRGRHAEEA